MDYQYKLTCA